MGPGVRLLMLGARLWLRARDGATDILLDAATLLFAFFFFLVADTTVDGEPSYPESDCESQSELLVREATAAGGVRVRMIDRAGLRTRSTNQPKKTL